MKRLGSFASLLAAAALAGCPAPDTVAGAGRPRPFLALPRGRLGPPEVFWLVRARWAKARGRRDLALRALAEAERRIAAGCRAPCDPLARLREGPDPCSGGTMQGGGDIKDAAPGHAKGILEAWQARPKGGEEQTLTVLRKK